MDVHEPGQFWKIPFIWEPGCALPPGSSALRFTPCAPAMLEEAVAGVMADSLDESDQAGVAELGATGAARELLAVDESIFQIQQDWWRFGIDGQGSIVGFVLPVLFRQDQRWKESKPQGTIYYMGVLPRHRGKGYGRQLLDEATRLFGQRQCWRIFCDMSAKNEPMLQAFRDAGYRERTPWQRPVR